MLKNQYKVLGVMSGTSLDGIDIVECDFEINKPWSFSIRKAQTIVYSNNWLHILKGISNLNIDELLVVDKAYTHYLAEQINSFLDRNEIEGLDFISSHGHTAKHRPSEGLTYQIGNLPELAILTNQKVVCDFRVQDVELGGQGAPLVPVGDELLFRTYDYCLNLGGFSNVSYSENNKRIAFDISPVNTVLNYYAAKLGLDYDKNGEVSSGGNINLGLFEKLNALDYYAQSWPKSLGIEWVHNEFIPLVDSFDLN
ncbi:MAG: anhydro-N-acetylmuramic acid kinase, partial [Bacteroidota bacterium]